MKILYITFIDFGELASGSSVRPQRMYDAFVKNGHDVMLLEGQQNRRADRKKRVKEMLDRLHTERPDICYIEPPSGPIFGMSDIKLIKTVRKLNIPMAVFYRDAHWLYADWWGVKGAKAVLLKQMHKRDLKVFSRCCDIVYFPSRSMERLFSQIKFNKTDILPPGCEGAAAPHKNVFRRMIYVGGVRPAYGTDIMLSAFDRLDRSGKKVGLILVCRESEMQNINDTYDYDWLSVSHASGEELKRLYLSSDAGVIPLRRDRYMDFAVPIKLLEYIGNGLPVIATDCTEVKAFVEKNECGIVCGDNADSIANAVEKFYSDEDQIHKLCLNAQIASENNLWENRAQKVVSDLSKL